VTPYYEELVLGMHVAKYANIIAIWFESLCWFLRDQFKELQVALQKITTWTTKLGKGCIEWKIVTFKHKASPLETQNLDKNQIY
jgi:hypothetical protein